MKKIWITTTIFFASIFLAWFAILQLGQKYVSPNEAASVFSPIEPSETHPQYWSKDGRNVMLLGGSVEDNLFQIQKLEEHLDLLKSVGGNYVRNTMSSRDSGNVWPFVREATGLYNLNQFNKEYWKRFDHFLKLTGERDIIVQIEVWATFDFYRDNWDKNPFNPKNNKQIDQRRNKLDTVVDTHPIYTANNFFRSVPSQMSLAQLLWYQQRYVDKLLSYALQYDHVLYCMDNETSVTSAWGKYWANYIQKKAKEEGKIVYCTEMWDPWDLSHPFHSETFDNPDIFGFVDISQNNHQTEQNHWDNGLKQIQRLKRINAVRPVTNIKVYGNDGGRHKTTQNSIEAFIQNVLMGCSSTRFHRPTSGQGLNENAQAVIKSMRSLVEKSDFFDGLPHDGLLSEREENEAYCRAIPGKEYIIYFPKEGDVLLELDDDFKDISIEWLDVLKSAWQAPESLESRQQSVKIESMQGTNQIAFITIK